MEPLLVELEKHRAGCVHCSPWSCCAVASKLLARLGEVGAQQIAPIPTRPVKA